MSDVGFTLIIGNRNYSTWSMRGWLACKLAGIAFEEIVIPLDRPDTAAALAKHSPSRRVPCLVHGQRVVWDSLAIAEYLAEVKPDAGLWPADARARARARSVVAEMHSGFVALRTRYSMDMIRRHAGMPPSAAEEADIARVDALWQECLQASGGPYLFGEWSLVDCFYAPVVSRFETYGFALSAAANGYCDAVKAHPHFQEWLDGAKAEPWEISLDVLAGV